PVPGRGSCFRARDGIVSLAPRSLPLSGGRRRARARRARAAVLLRPALVAPVGVPSLLLETGLIQVERAAGDDRAGALDLREQRRDVDAAVPRSVWRKPALGLFE